MTTWLNKYFPHPVKGGARGGFCIGLAPMDGVTDEPFRLTQAHVAKPDLIFTEFVNVEGLSRGGVKLYDQLLYTDIERPIIGQLFGKTPDCFYKSAVVLCTLGFDGIDLNMGCQAKRVTQHGSGGALITNPALASEIIKAVQSGVADWFSGTVSIDNLGLNQKTLEIVERNRRYTGQIVKSLPTVSVKTRLGVDQIITPTWIPHLLAHHLDFLTLHGRLVIQGHGGGVANWDEIKKAAVMAHDADTKLLGNGDLQSRRQALDFCQKYGTDGALIGRSVMGNPWAFSDIIPTWHDKFQVMKYHLQQYTSVFPHRRLDPLRRHFLQYTSGHPRAKELRSHICQLTHIDQLLALEAEYCHC